jgi:orotate phosphoribosyltransferase
MTATTAKTPTPVNLRAAKILLDTRSVLFNAEQPFTFTSGRVSPVYIDCRRLISFPEERAILMNDGAALLRESCRDLDYIAGGETAGIPYAAFISDRLGAPMLYVRKQPKGFGRMAQIEGCMEEEGANVILVEDLQTDGGSKKLFIDALRKAGAEVSDSFVIFHYGIFPASEANMKALGVNLHYLTDWWAVLEVAKRENSFDSRTLSAVESFLHAPDAWSPAVSNPAKS